MIPKINLFRFSARKAGIWCFKTVKMGLETYLSPSLSWLIDPSIFHIECLFPGTKRFFQIAKNAFALQTGDLHQSEIHWKYLIMMKMVKNIPMIKFIYFVLLFYMFIHRRPHIIIIYFISQLENHSLTWSSKKSRR